VSLKRYDAAQVTVILANILVESGYADGEFLTIEQDAPIYEKVVGTDGQVSRSRTNNSAAKITLKLAQTSDGNTLLGALANIGILAANGADIGTMLVRDRVSGTCMYTAANIWISEWPQVTYDNKVTMRNWTLECDNLIRVDTGS
jgi:hypothetical protein